MPKQKIDWKGLKREFMKSNYLEVKGFIKDKWMSYNSATRLHTKWWTKEKSESTDRAVQKALAKHEEKLANQLELPTEYLLWNINKAIQLSAKKLDQMEERWNINVKDLNIIRWMNRIQNNMPTTYVKSENENIERIEWIHIIVQPK